MSRHGYGYSKHCRWCGKAYEASKPPDRDGFDIKACKQAHWRAYKKWVTAKQRENPRTRAPRVTQKKR